MTERDRAPAAPDQPREARRDPTGADALLRRLLDSNMQGVMVWDSDGTVVEANDAFLRIAGFSRDELRAGQIDWLSLVPQGRLELARRARLRLFEAGELPATESELQRRDGTRVPMLVSGGRAPGTSVAVVFVQDLSESHRRAAAVRALEARVQAALQAAPLLLASIDRDGLLTWQEGTARVGLQPAVGQSIWERWRDRPDALALVRRALAGEVCGARFALPDRAVECHLQPVAGPGGAIEGVAIAAVDVSAQLRAEEERAQLDQRFAQVQRLESVGMLAGGLAHEFNNLLAGVLANVSAAVQASPSSPGAEALRDALSSAQRAAELTRQFLSTASGGTPQVRNLDVSALVRELGPLLQASVQRAVRLELELAAALPAVRGNPDQLRQALLALVAGAAEATAQGGRVRVATGLAEVGPAAGPLAGGDRLEPGWYLQLTVSDDGPPLGAEAVRRIFDPHFRGVSGGRSLGLAAVLGNVRALRGGVRLQSGEGGTRVDLLLPTSGEPDRPHAPPLPPPPSESRSVLVVDDDAVVRRASVRILQAIGITAREASTGDEAVRMLREDPQPVGLVLLDFAMPGMNGEQTLRAIRALRPGVRVLLCSGYSEQEATWRLEAGEATGFLAKPFTAKDLQRAVRFALEGAPAMAPTPPAGVPRVR